MLPHPRLLPPPPSRRATTSFPPRSLLLLVALLASSACPAQNTSAPSSPPSTTAPSAPSPAPVSPAQRNQPFILGADITFLLEDEAAGAQYFDHGVPADFLQILKNNRFNYVRFPAVVEPTRNFARGDLAHVETLARRAKAAGFGILLDFFYSDTWASPEGQPTPRVWANLTFPQMVAAVHDHTKAVLTALQAQGTTPDIVQIGNEITFGLDWPLGRVTSKISTGNPTTDAHNANVTDAGGWDNFAALLKAGISAVHEVDPKIKIMLHHSLGRNDLLVREWIYQLLARGVQFDIVGLSCYTEHETGDWKATMDDIATHYPNLGIIAVEYSGEKRYLNDLVFNTPNHQGLGSFIWAPTHPDKEPIFDHQTPASSDAPPATATANPRPNLGGRYDTNADMLLYPQMARAYANPPASVSPPK